MIASIRFIVFLLSLLAFPRVLRRAQSVRPSAGTYVIGRLFGFQFNGSILSYFQPVSSSRGLKTQ
jgi:hypothetical protein